MHWWPWLHSLRCVVIDAGSDKDMRKRGRADRGPTREHGNLNQCDHSFISIRVFFAENFVQYGTSLPLHSAIPPLLLTAYVTAALPRDEATRCDWLLATTNVEVARALHDKCF